MVQSHPLNQNTYGLILTGGGARGAYQAGVLKGVAEALNQPKAPLPFQVLSGSSAGAINCAYLASTHHCFKESCEKLGEIWDQIHFSNIYKTNTSSLAKLGFQWAKGLSFGGVGTHPAPNHLLNTKPLRHLIESKIDFKSLHEFEKKGGVLAINVTHYQSGAAVTFFSESNKTKAWLRSSRVSVPAHLTADYILASSAIPIFFPPVKIGTSFYGDGALRMKNPFSPAIHLGAKKILAIGVKKTRSEESLLASLNQSVDHVYLSDIAGVLLNSVFLDSLNADLERLERINRTVSKLSEEGQGDSLKPIEVLAIQPSQDLGLLASSSIEYFPKTVRYLLSGIGADGDRGSDLLSYICFHPSYTQKLVQLGYEDAMNMKAEIEDFFQ